MQCRESLRHFLLTDRAGLAGNEPHPHGGIKVAPLAVSGYEVDISPMGPDLHFWDPNQAIATGGYRAISPLMKLGVQVAMKIRFTFKTDALHSTHF